MKTLFYFAGIVLWGSVAHAQSPLTPELKIDSFYQINREQLRDRAAEVCGHIKNAPSPLSVIKLDVDPQSGGATYYTVAGSDGKFCSVVVTYSGRIKASLDGTSSFVSATVK